MRTSTGVLVLAVAVVGAGVAGGGPAAASPARPEAVKETRDPLLWPFARTSIWNTPIGARARYVPARIHSIGFGVDVDWFVVTRASDPSVPVYMPATFGEGRCGGTGDQQQPPRHPEARRTQHLRRSFLIPDATTHAAVHGTPNSSSAFLQPDRKTLVSYSVTARCRRGGPLYGQWFGETSLYGDGIAGGHGGSAMSSIGGSIRTGELTGRAPIRHALKLDVWGRYLFYDAATGGRRWPATLADGGASSQYRGRVRALRMGALLALPPSATAAELGVRSPIGRKVLAALRDYGGYVVDESGLDAVELCVEHQATVDFRKRTGHDIEADAGLRADMARMVRALAVVDDNGASAVGGHGARRAAWAPPFRAPGTPAPKAAPAAAAPRTLTTPPTSAIKAGQVAELAPVRQAPATALWALVAAALGLLLGGLWGGRRITGPRSTRGY
ncbi:MAG TPA: hypothetical protein VEV65_13690 [Kineosporiaceae bacterium]|nr:hypothetical protein [Kineosporiaceae bacterium]